MLGVILQLLVTQHKFPLVLTEECGIGSEDFSMAHVNYQQTNKETA